MWLLALFQVVFNLYALMNGFACRHFFHYTQRGTGLTNLHWLYRFDQRRKQKRFKTQAQRKRRIRGWIAFLSALGSRGELQATLIALSSSMADAMTVTNYVI